MIKLYQSSVSKAKCAIVSEVDDGFFVVPAKAQRLDAHFVSKEDFEKEWQYFEYEPRKVLETFLEIAKKHGASDRVQAYLHEAQIEIESSSPTTIEHIFNEDDGSTPKESDDDSVAAAFAGSAQEGDAQNPGVASGQEIQDGGVKPVACNTSKDKTNAAQVDAEQKPQGSHAMNCQANPVAGADLPDSPLSVTVSKSGLQVVFGGQNTGLTPESFGAQPCSAVIESMQPVFYVALDEKGNLVRSVTKCHTDRKNVAAIVGNWLAEGFLVNCCDMKGMMKLLRTTSKASASEETPE